MRSAITARRVGFSFGAAARSGTAASRPSDRARTGTPRSCRSTCRRGSSRALRDRRHVLELARDLQDRPAAAPEDLLDGRVAGEVEQPEVEQARGLFLQLQRVVIRLRKFLREIPRHVSMSCWITAGACGSARAATAREHLVDVEHVDTSTGGARRARGPTRSRCPDAAGPRSRPRLLDRPGRCRSRTPASCSSWTSASSWTNRQSTPRPPPASMERRPAPAFASST